MAVRRDGEVPHDELCADQPERDEQAGECRCETELAEEVGTQVPGNGDGDDEGHDDLDDPTTQHPREVATGR